MNIIKCESTACLVVFGILCMEFSLKSRNLVSDLKLEFLILYSWGIWMENRILWLENIELWRWEITIHHQVSDKADYIV